VRAGLGIDELCTDTNAITAPANAALHDITDTEFAPHLPDVKLICLCI
jgi:hypothetical protein